MVDFRLNKKRIPIPRDTEAEVLFKADHACCICNNSDFGVQVAHIDKNRNNNQENNLIVLCPNDHAKVDSVSPISKSYTQLELKRYKKNWEETVQKKRKALENPPSVRLVRFDGFDVNTVFLETEPDVLRGFQDALTFELLGFNWGNVDVYPNEYKNKFRIQQPLKKISDCKKIRLKFINGTLANEVYIIWEDGRKHWVPDSETLKEIGGFQNIEELGYLEFNSVPHGQSLLDIFQVRTKRILQESMIENKNEN